MLTVHGGALSPFVRKVLVVLEEKKLGYEQKDLVPMPKTPELLAMNPLGKIPIFEDGEFRVPDSSVICAYLEQVHREPRLYPQDAREYARALWFEEYGDTKLAEVATPPFFERFIKPRFLNAKPDEARIEQNRRENLPPVFDYLEGQVPASGPIVGGAFSIADVALCSPLVNYRLAGEKIDSTRWPKLAAYVERTLARPSFRKATEGLQV